MLLIPESILYCVATINFLKVIISRNHGYKVAEYGYENKLFAAVSFRLLVDSKITDRFKPPLPTPLPSRFGMLNKLITMPYSP